MKQIFKKLILILPSILIISIIFILSSQPLLSLPDIGIDFFDKLLHFIAYFILGISLQFSVFGLNKNLQIKHSISIVLIIGLAYAGFDEYHQSKVPNRDANIYDFIADAIGLVVSTLLINKIKNIVNSFLKNQ